MIAVFFGGFLGTLARVTLSTTINRYWPYIFPIATFSINCIGSFLIGIAAGLYLNDAYEAFFMIGFLGGFTTFSTFSVENVQLLLYKKPITSLFYILATVLICLLLTFIGIFITNFIYS
jgi:fluoride exporter